MHRFVFAAQLVIRQVQFQIAKLHNIRYHLALPPGKCADPCKQFLRLKRFCHIIIRAGVQPRYFIGHFITSRQ